MAILLSVTIIISVYIFTFKEDFKEDDVGKVTVFGLVILIILLIFTVLGSMGN